MKTLYLEKLLTTLWIGSLWAIGYIAVPTLFAVLDDKQVAGMLAGKMFTAVSFVGIFCGVILFTIITKDVLRPYRKALLSVVGIMLILVFIQEIQLQPMMAELKAAGIEEGSEQAKEFGMLHGIASSLYLVNSLLGIALVAWPREP